VYYGFCEVQLASRIQYVKSLASHTQVMVRDTLKTRGKRNTNNFKVEE
jgi:hypothetical protein